MLTVPESDLTTLLHCLSTYSNRYELSMIFVDQLLKAQIPINQQLCKSRPTAANQAELNHSLISLHFLVS
jgi:hypothetical protein